MERAYPATWKIFVINAREVKVKESFTPNTVIDIDALSKHKDKKDRVIITNVNERNPGTVTIIKAKGTTITFKNCKKVVIR